MASPQLLFTVGIVGIVSFLFLSIGFFKSQPKSRSTQLFLAISLCGIVYILNVLSFNRVPVAYRINLDAIAFFVDWIPTAVPPLFMMYCLSLFQEYKKIPLWLIAAFVVHLVLIGTWMWVYDHMATTPAIFNSRAVNQIGNYIIDLFLLGFSIGAVYWTIKDWRNDLIEGRRVLRGLFLGFLALIIFAVVIVENFLGLTDDAYMLSQTVTIFGIALFGFISSLLLSKFDYSALGEVVEKVRLREAPQKDDNEIAMDLDAFNHEFIEKKRYRQNSLTIAALADHLDLPEYRLRGLINKHLGFRNFSAMLHHYRIEDASQTLADRTQKSVPILTVALNVGYNSITPFNTAFRDLKGLTPSEFRKQALRDQLKQPTSTA